MTTFMTSGTVLTLDMDGGIANIAADSTLNPITGGMGLNTIRILNTTTANVATINFVPSDAEYTFTNLAGTPSGAGANAKFDVTVANSGYSVAIANAGTGYANAETISILGTAVGGSTTANDIDLTLTVGAGGKITSVAVAGTANWPQSVQSEITVLPSSEAFVQVTSNAGIGGYFELSGNGGNVVIAPVTIVG